MRINANIPSLLAFSAALSGQDLAGLASALESQIGETGFTVIAAPLAGDAGCLEIRNDSVYQIRFAGGGVLAELGVPWGESASTSTAGARGRRTRPPSGWTRPST